MLTIVQDTFTEGRHDLQKGMCSRKRFEMVAEGTAKRVFAEGGDINPKKTEEIPDHGCWENLSSALRPWNISPDDVPSPFNIFQCMRIDPETGEVLECLEMPPGVGVSGLESDGDERFYCGGGKSGMVRAVRRPGNS